MALIDSSFRVIAIDDTADAIFRSVAAASGHCSVAPLDRIPSRITDRLRRMRPAQLAAAHVEFRSGSRRYRLRLFPAEPQSELWYEPCFFIEVEHEPSAHEALIESAMKYNLSERELEALEGIANGLTSKEIATRMDISPSTVDQFLRIVMIKTGARNRAGILAKLLAAAGRAGAPGRSGVS